MYKFSLESVLNHRKFIEHTIQKKLSELQSDLNSNISMLCNLEKNQKCACNEISNKKRNGTIISEIDIFNKYIKYLDNQIIYKKIEINELTKTIEEQRILLEKAMSNRKMIEKLDEHQYKKYLASIERQDQIITDEVASIMYNKKP